MVPRTDAAGSSPNCRDALSPVGNHPVDFPPLGANSRRVTTDVIRTVLVPVDGSGHAIEGLEHACEEYPDADLVALHVVSFGRLFGDRAMLSFDDIEGWLDEERTRAEEILDEAAGRATELDQELTREVQLGRPASVIVAYAEERDVDHVVMGSRGESDGSEVPLGSVAESVMRDAPVLVTVVR